MPEVKETGSQAKKGSQFLALCAATPKSQGRPQPNRLVLKKNGAHLEPSQKMAGHGRTAGPAEKSGRRAVAHRAGQPAAAATPTTTAGRETRADASADGL